MRLAVRGAAGLTMGMASAASAQPAVFQTFDPGSLAPFSSALGVSADGSVVVGILTDGLQYDRVFRWTASTGMVDLGPGTGWDVSADGTTVAGATNSGLFRWQQGVGRTDVSLNSAPSRVAISADGTVAVATSGFAGWRWAAGSAPATVPGLGAAPSQTASGVSADGAVVVGSAQSGLGIELTRWTAQTGAVGLGRIPGGQYNSTATVVSADGSVIYGIGQGPSGIDTFRWTAATGMVGLGMANGGLVGVPIPQDVTPDGGIIVGSTSEAFVWTIGAGPQRLADVLTENFGINLGSFQLLTAMGISDDGRVIVGAGYDGVGRNVGWRVELPSAVPGPGSAALMVGMALAAARRRTRRMV